MDYAKQEVRDQILNKDLKRGRGRTKAEKDAANEKYFKNKQLAYEREQWNHDSLILYPAMDNEKSEIKFYNMGGNSALFYAHIISKRLKKRKQVKIWDDLDYGELKFGNGICMISDLLGFKKKMEEEIGAKATKIKNTDLIIFRLPIKFTDEEIEGLKKKTKEQRQQLRNLLFVKAIYPEIHKEYLTLVRIIPYRVKKTDSVYREMFGYNTVRRLLDFGDIYGQMGDGSIERIEGLRKLRMVVHSLLNRVAVFQDLKVWDIETCARIGMIIARMLTLIREAEEEAEKNKC